MVSKPFTPTTFGKYQLVERIASGGMAEVFRAILRGTAGFEKTVALKRILPFFGDDPAFVTLFQDEARIASTLSHANIAHVFDFGEVNGSYYLTMELVEGIDLARLGERMAEAKQPMPLATAAFLVAEAARGLAYAHEKKSPDGQTFGIVHRDVSPQNILISYEGEVKLTDFGIAKAAGKAHKTATGVVMGKLKYMSPEQVSGKALDPRSDIFSLGVILYELVTGGPVFPGEETVRLAELIHTAEIPPPSKRTPGIPPELDAIALKALARTPPERYSRAAELARDLSLFVNQHSPGFTREDLSAMVQHLAPRPVTSAAAAGWSGTREGEGEDRSGLAVAPTQLTPTPPRAASSLGPEAGPLPTSREAPTSRRTPAPEPRQLDLPTRTRLPDERKLPTEQVAPGAKKKRVSKEAWIGIVLAGVIVVSGALVLVRFALPGTEDGPAPDAHRVAARADAGVTGPAEVADAAIARLSEARRKELEGRIDRQEVALRGHPSFPDYLVFVTALDWEVSHLVTDDSGAVEPGKDPPPAALKEKLERYSEVRPAVELVGEYYRGLDALPPRVALPLKSFLERRPAWSRGDPGWGAGALAIQLLGRTPDRLVAVAQVNDALDSWCKPPPAPRRHRDPALCEPAALVAELRAQGKASMADAIERWQAAAVEGAKLGGAAVKLGNRSVSSNLDGSYSLTVAIAGPDNLDARLLVGEAELPGKKEAAGPPPDGGPPGDTRFTFGSVPKEFFAPVLEVSSGGEKVRLRVRPPSIL